VPADGLLTGVQDCVPALLQVRLRFDSLDPHMLEVGTAVMIASGEPVLPPFDCRESISLLLDLITTASSVACNWDHVCFLGCSEYPVLIS
jgi:hypothetical protein